jgi:endonuclease/exonuclease/phosphatase family metal-dependent hydrolase
MIAAAVAASNIAPPALAPSDLRIMAYNVHGLPWPISTGRPTALRAIGERLAQMRKSGNQPQIVLLQEAFTGAAKSIASEAKYPFVVRGPGRLDRIQSPPDANERQFTRADNKLKGEDDGKLEDSGLLVLSDYPIVDVTRMPYASYACAGYDCLANKGAVLVRIAVPGFSEPLDVIDTHLNSRGSSGVDDARADTAYAWQAEQLRAFVNNNVPATAPAIVAGDFNVGNTAYRRSIILGDGGVLPASQDALRTALDQDQAFPDENAARAIVSRGKDWMFVRSGSLIALSLQGVTVPFGVETNGKSLSDHFGYVAHYSIGRAKVPGT